MDRYLQRLILAAALALAPIVAQAQVQPGFGGFNPQTCPHTTGGWSLSWQPPLTSASWDSQTGLLYVVFYGRITQAFSNVPIGVIQALGQTKNPINIYNNAIIPNYHQVLLSEKDHCALRWEYQGLPESYIWTD